MFILPEPGILRQEVFKFETSLRYIASSYLKETKIKLKTKELRNIKGLLLFSQWTKAF